MLGYIVLRAKEDKYIKNEEGIFIFKKDKLYATNMQSGYFGDIKVFDERDNAIRYEYTHCCLKTGMPHYTDDFEHVVQDQVINKKEFRKIREILRIKQCNEVNDNYKLSMTICNFLGYSNWNEWAREYCLNDKNRQ